MTSKISEMPDGGFARLGDSIPVVRDGVNVRVLPKTIVLDYANNSATPHESMCHIAPGKVQVGQQIRTMIWYLNHALGSGGLYRVAEARVSPYGGTVGSFSSDGYIEGLHYRFQIMPDPGDVVDIRQLGVQCANGVTGWHTRMSNIAAWARANRIFLTAAGKLTATESVNMELVFFDFRRCEIIARYERTSGGSFPEKFFEATYTNREVQIILGSPMRLKFDANHNLSVNEKFMYGVSNGGKLAGGQAYMQEYYVQSIVSPTEITVASSFGGAALNAAEKPAGYLLFATNPEDGDTISLNGVTWTFVASGATGNQTNIQSRLEDTLTQLKNDLNASANTSIDDATYTNDAVHLFISHDTVGEAGHAFLIDASVAERSWPNLRGGEGTIWFFQGGTQSNIVHADWMTYTGKIVRKGALMLTGPGTVHGFAVRDNLYQSGKFRGDGNFDHSTVSSTIGFLQNGDRGPHGTYDFSANYCYIAAGSNTENEKHFITMRSTYCIYTICQMKPLAGAGTPDSMRWHVQLSDYVFGPQEMEGLDSYINYYILAEPRKNPALIATIVNEVGFDAPWGLFRNGKCSILSGMIRGCNGIHFIMLCGRSNPSGTSNRAWMDTFMFADFKAIHGHGIFFTAQNVLRAGGFAHVKDWEDPNVEDGHPPAPFVRIGRCGNLSGLHIHAESIKNSLGLQVGFGRYYSKDANLGKYSIEMGNTAQFSTGGLELSGASANPIDKQAVDINRMKRCSIDVSGCRGNGRIGPDVMQDSFVQTDYQARIYTWDVDPLAEADGLIWGYPSLSNAGIAAPP